MPTAGYYRAPALMTAPKIKAWDGPGGNSNFSSVGSGYKMSKTYQSKRLATLSANRYDPNSLDNPYGAGSPYKSDGLMNPYSKYGSKYSSQSWRNPYATNAPKIVSEDGTYHGRLSSNRYDAESTSNPYGKYGSRYSAESINNPYGAGSKYSGKKYYVIPGDE